MAKKKIDNKLIYLGAAIVGAILCVVGLFLNIWQFVAKIEGFIEPAETIKLFEAWPDEMEMVYSAYFNKSFAPIWSVLFEVIAIVTIVAIVVAIVLTLVKKEKLAKIVSYVAVGLVTLAIIAGCIFSIANHAINDVMELVVNWKWDVGAWLLVAGGVIGATGCVMATRK